MARGTTSSCTVLFVTHTPSASVASSARKPYLGKIRRRERENAKVWRRNATHYEHTRYGYPYSGHIH